MRRLIGVRIHRDFLEFSSEFLIVLMKESTLILNSGAVTQSNVFLVLNGVFFLCGVSDRIQV